MTGASAASALVPGARCATHGQRAATGVCGRCGDYLCGSCGQRVGERLYCIACAQRSTSEHSRRSLHALLLGLVGVHGVFVLAPVALTLATLELGAIRAGEAPVGGAGFARAGVLLGSLGIAMPVSALLAWLAMR
jgi:hypothetical protein